MANNDFPHGLNAVKMLNGGKIPMNQYIVATTSAIYQGDIVCLRAAGKAASLKTTGGAANIIGVAANYAAASGNVWVYDSPNTIFEIQSDGATDPGASTAQAQIGNTGVLIIATGNTTTYRSKLELDYSSVTTGTADPLQIIGYWSGGANDYTLAHARYLVLLRMKHLWATVPEAGNVI